jgi:DNA-binding MarR family transcriptional regulator
VTNISFAERSNRRSIGGVNRARPTSPNALRSDAPTALIDAAEPTELDPAEVAARLRLSVVRLARLLRQQDQGGLTPSQTAALATIDREGPLTLGQLAQHEQLAPPTITKIVAQLEAAGYVIRRVGATDRRVSQVEISPSGRRQLDANRNRRTAWLAARARDLEPEELERLTAVLTVLEKLAARPPEPGTPA